MEVNGIPNVRTCILNVQEGMVVKRQDGFAELPQFNEEFSKSEVYRPKVLVIGSGPAGLIASINLKRKGIDVLLLEQNPNLGGQLIKQNAQVFWLSKRACRDSWCKHRQRTNRRTKSLFTQTTLLIPRHLRFILRKILFLHLGTINFLKILS